MTVPPVRVAISSHGLATIAKAGSLDGNGLQDAANVVHHQCGQRFTIHIFGDDQQRAARLGDLLRHRKQVADVGNFLVVQQDVGILHQGELAILIVDEVWGQVAAVELHAFDDVQFIFQAGAIFNGDHAFFADLFHRRCDLLADHGIGIGGNAAHLGDFLAGGARLGNLFQFFNRSGDRLVDAAFQVHRVHAGGNKLHAFLNDGLCQHGCGGGAVTGHVGGFGSDFLDHLRTHVLELILQFDLFSDRYAIFSDSWRTIGAIQYYVAAFWAKRHFNCVGQNVHADDHLVACGVVEFYVFSCHVYVS